MKRRITTIGIQLIATAFLLCSFGTVIAVKQAQANPVTLGSAPARPVQAATDVTGPADEIVVYKSRRTMYLLKKGRILRKYRIALGKNPVGHKLEWGDNRTPEGKYRIDLKNPKSAYYLSIRISYPDATDADVAASLDVNPGDWIMIHGLPNGRNAAQVSHPQKDWTNGCIAVTNQEMDEIWRMVNVGTPISIWP